MKDIKYRAWDSFNAVYYYSDNHSSLSDFFKHVEEAIDGDNGITMERYTGLKDKDGKEVYEGDIFDLGQTVNGQSKFVMLGCIGEYDVRYAYDTNRKYEYSKKDLFKLCEFNGEFEVIGNINENIEED